MRVPPLSVGLPPTSPKSGHTGPLHPVRAIVKRKLLHRFGQTSSSRISSYIRNSNNTDRLSSSHWCKSHCSPACLQNPQQIVVGKIQFQCKKCSRRSKWNVRTKRCIKSSNNKADGIWSTSIPPKVPQNPLLLQQRERLRHSQAFSRQIQ